jgi:hypothetical protein
MPTIVTFVKTEKKTSRKEFFRRKRKEKASKDNINAVCI